MNAPIGACWALKLMVPASGGTVVFGIARRVILPRDSL
jgi:hypothetical protein